MNFKDLKKYCSENNVELVAVSKTRTEKEIRKLYDQGQRIFGENRVQEWLEKKELLPNDIRWHIIGHLQTNKVKYIIPDVELIHSIDSVKLLEKVNEISLKKNVVTNILLQYKVAQEETKFGIDPENDSQIIDLICELKNVRILGLMAMGTFTNHEEINRREFQNLNLIFERLKKTTFYNNPDFKIKSMGMSGDFELAIANGSNMVRVGSLLFKN